jgi:hypothetical protein
MKCICVLVVCRTRKESALGITLEEGRPYGHTTKIVKKHSSGDSTTTLGSFYDI